MFEESYVLWQNNSPGNIGLTMVGYIYQQGLAYNNMGYGSALGIGGEDLSLTQSELTLEHCQGVQFSSMSGQVRKSRQLSKSTRTG